MEISKNKATSSNQQSHKMKNNRRHFTNYCSMPSGRFSCAVASFLELAFAIFRDSIQHIESNEFFETLLESCVHLESFNVETDMTLIREPVWAYLRQHRNSTMSHTLPYPNREKKNSMHHNKSNLVPDDTLKHFCDNFIKQKECHSSLFSRTLNTCIISSKKEFPSIIFVTEESRNCQTLCEKIPLLHSTQIMYLLALYQ